MAERELVALNETTPQLEAAQTGDTYLLPRSMHVADGAQFISKVADGASAVAHDLDTANALSTSGAKLLSLKSNGTEKAYLDKDGVLVQPGLGSNKVAIGPISGSNNTATVVIGDSAVEGGHECVSIGKAADAGQLCVAIGSRAAGVFGSLSFGAYAGFYETGNYKLYLDSFDRSDEATGRAESIIYGIMSATVANQELRFNAAYGGREFSSDPADPAEGNHCIWQSDGTGAGDDGDIMMKITAGGVTKTITLVDYSTF